MTIFLALKGPNLNSPGRKPRVRVPKYPKKPRRGERERRP
jgi:hypothetical protein